MSSDHIHYTKANYWVSFNDWANCTVGLNTGNRSSHHAGKDFKDLADTSTATSPLGRAMLMDCRDVVVLLCSGMGWIIITHLLVLAMLFGYIHGFSGKGD
jgi:hypothetical protein